jgi:hypothetical protein
MHGRILPVPSMNGKTWHAKQVNHTVIHRATIRYGEESVFCSTAL